MCVNVDHMESDFLDHLKIRICKKQKFHSSLFFKYMSFNGFLFFTRSDFSFQFNAKESARNMRLIRFNHFLFKKRKIRFFLVLSHL